MNFYPHHIGDYLTATAHLTWLEDCAYRRLLDVYYSREQAIPADVAQACRLVRAISKDERKAVETVLGEFFEKNQNGWVHSRCDEEIIKAKDAAARARANGKKGGRPSKAKPTDNPEETHSVNSGNPEKSKSQAPITNPITSYSVTDVTGGEPPSARDEVFANGVPLLMAAAVPEKNARSMLAMLCKKHGEESVAQAVAQTAKDHAGEPVSWIQTLLNAGSGPPPKRANAQEALEASNRAVMERMLAKENDATQ